MLDRTILKEIYDKRESLAIRIGLTGIILILISLLAIHLINTQNSIIQFILVFIGRIGEVFFLAGFIAFALEQHPLSEMARETTKSIIDELIDKYFPRKELIEFMLKCTRNLNKFEDIDSEIYSLYEKHGLLELANEPRRSNLSVTFKNDGDIEGQNGKILFNRIYDYRVTNEAHIGGKFKKINGDGLVSYYNTTLPDRKKYTSDEIIKCINNYLKIKFIFTTSFELSYSKEKIEKINLDPIFISRNDFDIEKCRPKSYNKDQEKPELYGVFEVPNNDEGDMILEYSLYFNVEIPPKEYIDLHLETKGIADDSDLWMYDFISWTEGVTFEMEFGDGFETKIVENLIGTRTSPHQSNIKLRYNGWVMPHSTICGSWRRL